MFRSTLLTKRISLVKRIDLKRTWIKSYGTRSASDSPFDYLPQRKKPYINWKTTGIFFIFGSILAYNETLFDVYESMTNIEIENDELLPIQLEYKLKQLPIYQQLSHPKNESEWIKLQSWENLDRNVLDNQGLKPKGEEEYKKPSITTQTLAKPGGILIKPVIFYNKKTNETISIIHAGYKLCGYPFIVHGGIIATFLNETFKRNASLSTLTKSNLKGDFKVENVEINYKFPTFANQFLILKTIPKEVIDDKAIILQSVLESQKGKLLVKSEATLHDTGRASNLIREERRKWYIF